MIEAINTFVELGLSPIPVFPADHPDRPKRPVGSWKQYQDHVPTLREIRQLFPSGNSYSVALVAGKVSGNLEIHDFDAPELFQPFMDQLRAARPGLADLLLTQQTPSGGYHLLYRCTEPGQGNLKLARSADGKTTMIETRGEGGYFLVSPSPGYRLESDISLLQTITAEDRAFLHGLARSFDQHTEQTREPKRETSYHTDGDRPGDVLERVADWNDLLTADGWQYLQTIAGRHHYSRPGKTPPGTSATVNEMGLYCFTSNTPLPVEQPIRKLAYVAYSRFNGDFTAAARWVVETHSEHFPRQYATRQEEPPFPADDDYQGQTGDTGPEQGTKPGHSTPPSRDELSITDSELATANLTPTCFVEEYLYADVANLSAPGGTGKTTLVLYEAICIALGRPVHGMKVMKPGWTLIITAEDQRERLVARLREIMNSMSLTNDERKVVMRSVLPWDVTGEQRKLIVAMDGNLVLTTLADDIVTAYQQDPPALIVFDPLVSFGVSESMVNDNEQAIVTACRRIVKGLDSCVRLIAHTGKANAREKTLDQYSSRGGSALSDGARMVAVLQTWKAGDGMQPPAACTPSEESSITILARPKLSYAKPNLPNLWIRRTGHNFETFTDIKLSDEEREAATLDQVERFLESEVQQGHRHTKTSLETIPNLTRAEVRKAISILMAHGRIIEVDLPPDKMRTKRKTYLTTPAGFGRIQKNDDSNSAEKTTGNNAAAYREKIGGRIKPPIFPPVSNPAAIPRQDSAGLAGLDKETTNEGH